MRNHKISTGKKIFVALVATIGFLTFSSLSLADALSREITTAETAPQEWPIDTSDTNAVTFQEQGSISVTEANPDMVIAANVAFDGLPGDTEKAASMLTVNFNNAPSVGTDIDKPESEGEGKVQAHIYAKSEQNNIPAVGISLEQGANLAIEGTTSHRPTIAAYANVYSDTAGANANSAAVTISAANTNRIELNDNSSLFSSSNSNSNSSNIYSYSASSVIGSAIGYGNATTSNLTVMLGNNNNLTSSSASAASSSFYSYSASSVIGAAVGTGNATTSNLAATLGNNNDLTSTTTSPTRSHSASSVIGAAVGYGNATTSNLTVMLGNNNTLTAYSYSTPPVAGSAFYSASSVIGSAVGCSKGVTGGVRGMVEVNTLTATLGDYNILSASSSSSSSSSCPASSVIGAAMGSWQDNLATVAVSNLTATLGDGNTLTSSSSSNSSFANSSSCPASSVIGAAVGYNDVATVAVSNLTVALGNNNNLTSSAYFIIPNNSFSVSASSVIGAAVSRGIGKANAVTVNMNGSQTLSAVAYAKTANNIMVNTFGADNTDKGDSDFGWRVGIFAAGTDIKEGDQTIFKAIEGNSTVNILGAKLEGAWEIEPDTPATATLGGNQGQDEYDNRYARAFALGNDFKIYIGGMADPVTHGFIPVSPANGTSGVVSARGNNNIVNIIGAINIGFRSDNTEGSSLTVDSGWTVNAFGPVENLAEISVTDGSHLNIYGPMRYDVISGGEVMVYGATADYIYTIELREGNLHLARNDDGATKFNDAIGQIAEKMTYKDPLTGTLYKGSEGKIAINTDTYPWKGADAGGQLTLDGDEPADKLIFHVDSSRKDPKIESTAPNGDDFELVKGYVTIDAGMQDAIVFNGGQIAIANDDTENPGTLPAHADFWLIRSTSNESTDIDAIGKMFGFNFAEENKFELVDDNLYKLTSDYAEEIFSKGINPYANWDAPLDVYIFNDPAHDSSGLFLGTGETPRHAVPSRGASSHANSELASLAVGYANAELASLAVDITTLVSKTLYNRMASIKGWFGDPFIHVIYEHSRQAEIAGFGYNNNTGGFLMGVDNIWTFPNERYLSLGAAFGYVHGKTNFFGSASGLEKSAKHDAFTLALFSAYELFNDKHLKTNIRLILGYSHGKDSLFRTDPNHNDFSGNLRSNNAFLGLEFVKNLYAHNGCQFGLWCRANYSRIAQKGYDESSSATMGAQHVSAINHNFLATVVGINIEKEVFNPEYADRKLTLSLKAGWESQIMRKHSDARASFDNGSGVGEFSPVLGYPAKNAAIVSLGAAKKLNVNWSITGSYVARVNKDISIHNLSCGIKYSF